MSQLQPVLEVRRKSLHPAESIGGEGKEGKIEREHVPYMLGMHVRDESCPELAIPQCLGLRLDLHHRYINNTLSGVGTGGGTYKRSRRLAPY